MSLGPASRDLSPRGLTLIIVSAIVWSIAAAFVGLRFVARRGPIRPGLDDWTVLISLVLALGLVISSIIWAVIGGGGWHTDQLSAQQLEKSLKAFFAIQIFYSITAPMIKTSILLLYKRIFSVKKRFHVAANLVELLVIGWGLGTLFSFIFQCSPVKGAWEPQLANHCINAKAFSLGNGISNMLIDVVILCMPIPMIWNLQMEKNKKVGLTGIFLLGSFACVASIVRITTLMATSRTRADFSYNQAESDLWSCIEACVGIMCACMPTLYPLIKDNFQRRILSKTARSEQKAASGGQSNNRGYTELEERRLNEPMSVRELSDTGGSSMLSHYGRMGEHGTMTRPMNV